MNSTPPLTIRSRPVLTPLILSPIPFAPPRSDNTCKDCSNPEALSASSDRMLTPFVLSPFSCQSSASAYSCDGDGDGDGDSCSYVEGWAEISMRSPRSCSPCPCVPHPPAHGVAHTVRASQNPKCKWEELRLARALRRPLDLDGREAEPAQDTLGTRVVASESASASEAPPTPTSTCTSTSTSTSPVAIIPIPETRAYLRKLRSRSLAALQLEGACPPPHVPSHSPSRQRSQHRKTRVHSDTDTHALAQRPRLSVRIPVAIPVFTPSIFLASPPLSASPLSPSPASSPPAYSPSSTTTSSNSGTSQPPLTPSSSSSSPPDTHTHTRNRNATYAVAVDDVRIAEDPVRASRWERRPTETISNRRLGLGLGLGNGNGLPKRPAYVPVEGVDARQDERLRVRRSRAGVVFTVARVDRLARGSGGGWARLEHVHVRRQRSMIYEAVRWM
ncbi:hypothetical protein PLEOSDRAFT_162975 [Pleurotus ostreatus PC15]|uniref:Uncharacterized protein n=1 Tax=Pleurotus ostreatus (strain PC15) TaxID=1137138 RepID=A0A067NE48_PLEO1|nr:hypothetical protein PLEOSDRAFT_162975 [Pleurotus ostreatus PC15]